MALMSHLLPGVIGSPPIAEIESGFLFCSAEVRRAMMKPDFDAREAVMQRLYKLSDYPQLEALARARTEALRLDGRACLHLYKTGLADIDWLGITPNEREFMCSLGIFNICPCCGAMALQRDTRDFVSTGPDGAQVSVQQLTGDYCGACGEVVLDAIEGDRLVASVSSSR
jgi:YgiT-type zinc finger domain-containing protein